MKSPSFAHVQVIPWTNASARRVRPSGTVGEAAKLPKAPGSQKRLSEDSSSVWRMRASMPVATVATQSVRHRSPEAAGRPNVSGPNRCEELIQRKPTAQVDQPRSKPDDGARPYQPRMRPSLRSRRKIFRGSIWAFLNRAARCSESSKRCRRRLPRRRRPHRRAAQFLVA